MEFNKIVEELLEEQRALGFTPSSAPSTRRDSKNKNSRQNSLPVGTRTVTTPAEVRNGVQPPPLPRRTVAAPTEVRNSLSRPVTTQQTPEEQPVQQDVQINNPASSNLVPQKHSSFSNFARGVGSALKTGVKTAAKIAAAPITVPLKINAAGHKLAGKLNNLAHTGRFNPKDTQKDDGEGSTPPSSDDQYNQLTDTSSVNRAASYNKLFANTPSGIVTVSKILNPNDNNSMIKWVDKNNKSYITDASSGDFYTI